MKRCLFAALLAAVACSPDKDVVPPDPGPATYRLTFEASWSAATHPQAYPPGAHFSRLIGATHARVQSACVGGCPSTVLFEPGTLASPGIRHMAERGDNAALRQELQALQPPRLVVGTVFESRLGFVDSPGRFVDTITVDARHPLVSAVSMIAPSPDWFVALESQSLLDERGQWRPQLSVAARAYDAGTDSGPDFLSPDAPTTPARPVELLGAGPLRNAAPLGTFRLERIR